ncbi:MAG: ABC transporter substrate-binding protein [Euryarchaeota archaeon]|nr:ABC transporter substrate-binding protein [Euryarchaeota archaeon]
MKIKTGTILAGIATTMLLLVCCALPAAASDHTLEIFGNANEDETINMQDVTYTELIILEYRDQTDLADGKHDGKINMQDVTQIELIILGIELELAYLDCNGEVATVEKPIERIVAVYDNTAEVIRILGARDRVVGVDDLIMDYPTYFPELGELPCVGSRWELDVEAILELDPNIVILGNSHTPTLEEDLVGTGIDVVRVCVFRDETPVHKMMRLGYILDEEENACEYLEWHLGKLAAIEERVSDIPADEMPRVFVDRPGGSTVSRGSGYSEAIETAGGINIAADLVGGWEGVLPKVDPEWVLEQNPDVIIGLSFNGGYETDDENVTKERYNEILGMPGFDNIRAVKDGKVYVTHYILIYAPGPGYQIGVAYTAKWLHPDLFEDLDPQAVHQEYIDRFQGIDFDVKEHGVFVYPTLEAS